MVLDLGVGSTKIYFNAAQRATGDRKALERTEEGALGPEVSGHGRKQVARRGEV